MCNKCVIGWGYYLANMKLMTYSIRYFFNYEDFVVLFNYFKRLGLVIFMYHMYVINQQVVGQKNAMPYDYPYKWAILVAFLTKTKIWCISITISKSIANNSLQCGLASKQFYKLQYKIDTHSRATRNAKA